MKNLDGVNALYKFNVERPLSNDNFQGGLFAMTSMVMTALLEDYILQKYPDLSYYLCNFTLSI